MSRIVGRHLGSLRIQVVFFATIVGSAPDTGTADAPPVSGPTAIDAPPISRVRSGDRTIIALIDRAAGQSLTFKKLLTTIASSDGIVYVEPGNCSRGAKACLQIWMHVSGANRFLRILVDRKKANSDVDFMGSIGHELQHAIEALSQRSITDGDKLYNFFKRIAPTDDTRFETAAAERAGDDIRHELRGR